MSAAAIVSEESTRSAIYDAFARRVLGPPPEQGSARDNEGSLFSAQLLELLMTVAKKA
ncbi:DUF3604 domain-containing protein [Cryobacterium sp. PAMC25264]|uniref:DUF3604 domain-containing protein n=1 Tax=Cryobacterium sp. PAMC25264 TaxID=2861288 RepID=UPI001C626E9D|nr:DUF3604 domain-containing protein [Cryobacterium sp. PAMC25264]QYF74752.1 DUF3604 domain-containing protein [Cryobacterium sp. PAMC25264]